MSIGLTSISQNTVLSYERTLRVSSGTWDPVITKSTSYNPEKIMIEDADNDGFNDIITICGSDIIIFLWNTTTSDWADGLIVYNETDSEGEFFIGDANNDELNDIIAPNSQISLWLWNETINDWNNRTTLDSGTALEESVIGDVNADGYNDIVSSGSAGFSLIHWNESAGDWDTAEILSSVNEPFEMYLEDANNDGYNDITAVSLVGGYYGTLNITVNPWNNSLMDWDPQIILDAGEYLVDVVVGDINNDGFNDIVVPNDNYDTLSIFFWNDTIDYWNDRFIKNVGNDGLPYYAIHEVNVADANNDFLNDFVTANYELDSVSIYLWNKKTSDWKEEITKSVGTGPIGVCIGDANNDGYNDIVTANYDGNSISIILWHETAGPPAIAGYEVSFFLIIIGAISVIIIKKSQKKIK